MKITGTNNHTGIYVKLPTGEEKKLYSEQDAMSWAIQQSKERKIELAEITFEYEEKLPPLPKDYNPDNREILRSNRMMGGKDSDFTDEFSDACK